jgi:hypothetical protein
MTFDLQVVRYSGPELAVLDESGRRIVFRGCDLAARHWLIDVAFEEYSARNYEGTATLIHAEHYLADRLAYELAPWPEGMIKIPQEEVDGTL